MRLYGGAKDVFISGAQADAMIKKTNVVWGKLNYEEFVKSMMAK